MMLHSMYEEFIDMARRNYDRFIEITEKIQAMSEEEYILSIPNDDFTIYQDCMYISIVFEAMAVEAFINWYGSCMLGYNAYKHFEKLKTEDKILGVVEYVTGRNISDKDEYKTASYLVQVRNRLMHYKAISLPDSSEQLRKRETVLQYSGDGKNTYYDIAKIVHGACTKLRLLIEKNEDPRRDRLLTVLRKEDPIELSDLQHDLSEKYANEDDE